MTISQDYFKEGVLPGRLYPVIKDLADAANEAETGVADALETSGFALLAANGANQRLAGDNDFFDGVYTFSGTPTQLIVPSFSNVSSQGIDYAGGFFNFSYLGHYFFYASLIGDCANGRGDWYQEVNLNWRNNGNSASDLLSSATRLPPTGTWNFRQAGSVPIKISSGDQWRPIINMSATASVSGTAKLRVIIKKIV